MRTRCATVATMPRTDGVSASVERRYVEFYITLITSGGLTPRLFALKHGSRVFLGPKASGVFTLDRTPARHSCR